MPIRQPAKPFRGTPLERPAPAVPPKAPSRDLQVFANPAPERDYLMRFHVPEFTCLYPLTGQPNFAHFTIEMVAAGGIRTTVTAEHFKKGWKPAPRVHLPAAVA